MMVQYHQDVSPMEDWTSPHGRTTKVQKGEDVLSFRVEKPLVLCRRESREMVSSYGGACNLELLCTSYVYIQSTIHITRQ